MDTNDELTDALHPNLPKRITEDTAARTAQDRRNELLHSDTVAKDIVLEYTATQARMRFSRAMWDSLSDDDVLYAPDMTTQAPKTAFRVVKEG